MVDVIMVEITMAPFMVMVRVMVMVTVTVICHGHVKCSWAQRILKLAQREEKRGLWFIVGR